MSTKKTTKPHKSGAKKEESQLKGAGAAKLKAATKGAAEKLAKPAGVLGGLVLSSVASNLMDKVPFLAPGDGTETGIKKYVKKYAKPVILLTGGITTIIVTHKKEGAGWDFANGLGWGVAGGGAFSGFKALTGKSLVSGLGNVGDSETTKKAVLDANYYKAQAEDLAKVIEENKFMPKLPAGSEEEVNGLGEEEVSGLGKDWGSSLLTENSPTIL